MSHRRCRRDQNKRHNHQYRRDCEGDLKISVLLRVYVKRHGESCAVARQSLKISVKLMREACRIKQRRGFAEYASDGENDARYYAVNARRQNDRAYDAPFARAESERALAVRLCTVLRLSCAVLITVGRFMTASVRTPAIKVLPRPSA